VRVAALNLRAYFNDSRRGVGDLPQLIADQEADLVLLQECRRPWFDSICDVAGVSGIHSHDVEPRPPRKPPDGCAIAVRAPIEIVRSWRLGPECFQPAAVAKLIDEETPAGFEEMPENLACRNAARNVFGELKLNGKRFVVAALHATPGTARVSKKQTVDQWKPFFHGAIAIELATLNLPFVFAIDANEPETETAEAIQFHWKEGTAGFAKIAALLGLRPKHRGRDLLRESLKASGQPAASETYLVLTHTLRGGEGRRFDSIWASPEFALRDIKINLEDALAARTDHALLVADLELT
jgi:hypothetical protein